MTAQFDLGLLRRNRVRPMRQTEYAECGLAALAMVASYHKLEINIAGMRGHYAPSSRGQTLKDLIGIANDLGFSARALRLPLEEVEQLFLPAILHWNLNHFVVIERVRGGKAFIHDPISTSRWYTLEEMSAHFTGVALELRPAPNFRPRDERQRLKIWQLWTRISGLKRALVQFVLLSVLMQVFALAMPYYMQLAVDRVVPSGDVGLLSALAIGFGLLTLFSVCVSVLRSHVLLVAGTSLSFTMTVNFARHLFRLPIPWFEKRSMGDILSRFHSVSPIEQALTQGAVGVVLDGILAIATLALLFFYSVPLTLLAISAFALYSLLRAIAFPLQRARQEHMIQTSAKEQTVLIETIRGITPLRLSNGEGLRHALWQGKLGDSANASVAERRVAIWLTAAETGIFGLEAVLSIWLATHYVLDGSFTVGMVFAFAAYKLQLMGKTVSLIEQAISFRMLGLHLERLADVALTEEAPGMSGPPASPAQLNGRLELRDITFRYAAGEPAVLDGASLVVEPGEHVAITGPSGGGKSTLVKILLGLAEPESGQVLVDGVPLAQFGYKNFYTQLGVVLQDDSLFTGSIGENITMFDESPDPLRLEQAARDAAIHDEIMTMPMRYESIVGDMGSAISGGQKQRVLLARALYRRPRLLVVDEGTSHLDLERERHVNDAIGRAGITRIIIAHRPETIRSAAKIYRLEHGRLSVVGQAAAEAVGA
jgi:ATP-binding cassette subfamily B protein RaxB